MTSLSRVIQCNDVSELHFINRVGVQHAVKEVARFMAEPSEGAWIMLKRLVWYFVGHGRLVQVIAEHRYVKSPRVDTDSDHV